MMKYLIIRVEYITNGEKTVCRQEIPTEDIEKTRKELNENANHILRRQTATGRKDYLHDAGTQDLL